MKKFLQGGVLSILLSMGAMFHAGCILVPTPAFALGNKTPTITPTASNTPTATITNTISNTPTVTFTVTPTFTPGVNNLSTRSINNGASINAIINWIYAAFPQVTPGTSPIPTAQP